MAVAMKNDVFCDVTQCGSCKNRRFGDTYPFHHQGYKNLRVRNNVSSNYQPKHVVQTDEIKTAVARKQLCEDSVSWAKRIMRD
jgi:hypothetical protein